MPLLSSPLLIALISSFLLLPRITLCQLPINDTETDCSFLETEEFPFRTHQEVLFSRSHTKQSLAFDDDHEDFDIFLRLMSDVKLTESLKEYTQSQEDSFTTIFVPRDLAIIQSAMDMKERMVTKGTPDVNESKPFKPDSSDDMDPFTELEAYRVIISFANRFLAPELVLIDIMRTHVTPTKISMCEYLASESWTTWSNKKVFRRGTRFFTGNKLFDQSQLFLSPPLPQIRTSEGFIQHIDRMIIPELIEYELLPSPTPTSSQTPSPSVSPAAASFEISKAPTLSATPTPLPPTVTPSVSLKALPPPIPSISDAFVPFSTAQNTPTATPSPTDGNDSAPGSISQSSRTSCFPASAFVYLSRKHLIRMRDLQIGQSVMTCSDTKSEVFMFSHRIDTPLQAFVQIRTVDFKLAISHGHLIYLNGRLRPASDARVGDELKTLKGEQTISVIGEVWERGLYAPHTMKGDIVVDGIITSCYTTAVKATIAHTFLTPLRAMTRTRIVTDPSCGILDGGVHPVLTSMLSRIMQSIVTT